MAYNPAMYYPTNAFTNNYTQPFQQPVQPVQSYGGIQPVKGAIEWVDGEVGAKAFQIPMGMTMPIALWDSNEPVIYLRSVNQMGMPNPIKRIRYVIEEDAQSKSGPAEPVRLASGEEKHSMDEYVRKDELQEIKEELLQSIREAGRTGSRRTSKEEQE